MLTEIPALCLISYLIGSIPFGVVLARAQRIDIRKQGSGNIGATNVARVLGKKAGLLTLLGDVLKGLFVVFGAGLLYEKPIVIALTGLMVFLGHLYSIFLKFKGGKGVATALGVVLAIHPLIALIQIASWLLVALVFRYSSLAALVTAAATPLYLWLAGDETSFIVLGAVLAVLLCWRHRQNIERLIARTESKIRLGR